jgi:hypothetical protein
MTDIRKFTSAHRDRAETRISVEAEKNIQKAGKRFPVSFAAGDEPVPSTSTHSTITPLSYSRLSHFTISFDGQVTVSMFQFKFLPSLTVKRCLLFN